MEGDYLIREADKNDWPKIIDRLKGEEDYSGYTSLEDLKIECDFENVAIYLAEDRKTSQILGHAVVTKHGVSLAYIRLNCVRHSVEDNLWKYALDSVKTRNVLTYSPSNNSKKISLNGLVEKYLLKSTLWKINAYIGLPLNWETIWKKPRHTELRVCHAQMVLPEDLADFEKQITNLHRIDFWREFIRHSNDDWVPESVSLIVTKDSSILGFGVIRPGPKYARMGPLYALNSEVARLLLRNLMGSSRKARENGIEICVPDCNDQMITFMQLLKMPLAGTYKLYYSKFQPKFKYSDVYAVCNAITQFV